MSLLGDKGGGQSQLDSRLPSSRKDCCQRQRARALTALRVIRRLHFECDCCVALGCKVTLVAKPLPDDQMLRRHGRERIVREPALATLNSQLIIFRSNKVNPTYHSTHFTELP